MRKITGRIIYDILEIVKRRLKIVVICIQTHCVSCIRLYVVHS
jgi:hypothetical protein